jgi:hypothetical protein
MITSRCTYTTVRAYVNTKSFPPCYPPLYSGCLPSVLSRRMPRSTASTASALSSFDAQYNPDGVMSLERRLERRSTPAISLHALLDALHEIPMLQYFELRQCFLLWNDEDASRTPPIQMPRLMYFSVQASSLRFFTLNQRFALPEGAKRRLVTTYQFGSDLGNWATWVPCLLTSVPRATADPH